MKALLTDPVVLITSGIIVIAIIAFFWALGKFRRLGSYDSGLGTDSLLPPAPDIPGIDFRAPEFPTRAASAAPAVSKDVADRLESMSQRLLEMQTVLNKQPAASPSGGTATGAVGQGFSPETIDKLLKIIGNVIQQVDLLQKNLKITK